MKLQMQGSILIALCIGVFFLLAVLVPYFVSAQTGAADAMCTPVDMACPCGTIMGPNGCVGGPNMHLCPCYETHPGGKVSGICGAQNKCLGKKFEGDVASGGLDPGALGALSKLVEGIMGALKGGGGGGGAGDMPPPPAFNNGEGQNGCTTYYQVTVPSSDPCAIYNPNAITDAAGGTSGVSSGLLDALNGGGSTNTSKATTTKTTPSTPAPTTAPTNSNVKPAAPGLSGDVRIGSAGATIIANLRQGLSEVAGFFGGSTGGASQALSAAGKLCSSRPWQGTFVSNVIPTSFFDGLCEWRGYQVGMVAPKNTSTTTITPTTNTPGSQQPRISLQPGESNIPPEVDIWAEPASVRLGTRTYIFWNTRGVASCKETGPSFSQSSFSGGASTVPISGPTTFTIECLTSASSTVKDSVTVQIAI